MLLEVTNSGGGKPVAHHAPRHKRPAPHFIASHVTVAVLNGTAVTHLAKDVSTKLSRAGYKQGTVANAAVQTHTGTIVAYLRGQRAAAVHVAKALDVSQRSIEPADHDAIGMCSASAAGRWRLVLGRRDRHRRDRSREHCIGRRLRLRRRWDRHLPDSPACCLRDTGRPTTTWNRSGPRASATRR